VLTQFGRACKQLGIEIITAHSPQAKGRVERNLGTYQDRLVKELRLAEISTIEAGNQFLPTNYCEQINQKFAVPPRARVDYHRSVAGYDLPNIFCIEEERTITTDWTVRFANQYYQLQPLRKAAIGKGTVLVRRYLNGELHFCYCDRDLPYTLLPERPNQILSLRRETKSAVALSLSNSTCRPANHVWRSCQFGKGPPWAR
jgi:hypothetical protein